MAKSEILQPKFTGTRPNGYMNILNFFRTHVVEVKFKRRNWPTKKGGVGHRRNSRRMLCTSNWKFVASPVVKNVFHWKKPSGPAKGYQWYSQRNLIITWDILNQDWRMVNLDNWEVVAAVPVERVLEKASFLALYHGTLEKMSRTSDPTGHSRNSFADK